MHQRRHKPSVRIISSLREFRELEPDWNRLSRDVPFRSFAWNYHWWRHFGADRTLSILAVFDGSLCIGIAPFYVQHSLTLGRTAHLLGSGEVASDHLSILSTQDHCDAVGRAVADWFAGIDVGVPSTRESVVTDPSVELLQLDGISAHCPTLDAFLNRLQQLHFSVHDQSTVSTWRIDLPPTMDLYLKGLSKPSRRKVRKAMKHFADRSFVATSADSEESFETIWATLAQLHQRRRESLGDSGRFANHQFSQFLLDAAKHFHASGMLDLVQVASDDGPIAAEICFRDSTTCFAYQIGIAPDALAHNPGWLVNTTLIQRAIELGLSQFDLCRGDAEYKHHLGAVPTVCRRLRIVPPVLRSQFLNTAIATGSAVKHFCQFVLHGANTRS